MNKRVVLKLSGNAFGVNGQYNFGLISDVARRVIAACRSYELILIVGGGNISRGKDCHKNGFEEEVAHNIGLLSTIINGLILKNELNKIGADAQLLNSYGSIPSIENYSPERAKETLEKGKTLICVGGIGITGYSTDSGALYRARELNADLVLKGSRVDAIYDDDPEKNRRAKKIKEISYNDYLKKDLKVIDKDAALIAKEHRIKIRIFNLFNEQDLAKVISGDIGSTIC